MGRDVKINLGGHQVYEVLGNLEMYDVTIKGFYSAIPSNIFPVKNENHISAYAVRDKLT